MSLLIHQPIVNPPTPPLPTPVIAVVGKQLAACNHSADDNVKRGRVRLERHSGQSTKRSNELHWLRQREMTYSVIAAPSLSLSLSLRLLSISLLALSSVSAFLLPATKNCTLDHVTIILFVANFN